MIPGNALSPSLAIGTFVQPDELYDWCKKLVDYEDGGIALNDPSQGMRVRAWRIVARGPVITIDVPDAPEILPQVLYTASASVSEISLAFDQNMAPALAFVEASQARFWYFDTDTQTRQILELPGCKSPRCFLDDKRSSQTSNSDIILVYLRDGGLYYRQQRDRYLVERFLKSTEAVGINRVGMTHGNRVQIELVFGNDYPTPSICVLGSAIGATPGEYYTSAEMPLNQWVPIDTAASVLNGEYRYKWNAFASWSDWTSSPISVAAAGIIQARGIAPLAFDTTLTVRVTIGETVCTFPITTYDCADAINFIVFESIANSLPITQHESDVVVAHECILPNSPVSISAGEYRINAGEWTSLTSTMSPGDSIRVRHTSAYAFNTQECLTLSIGQFTGNFCITTIDCTNAENFLAFTPLFDRPLSIMYLSNVVTAHECILPNSPVSISIGEYRINAGEWTSLAGTMSPSDSIQIRLESSSEFETEVCAELIIGQFTGSFCITTRSESGCINEYERPAFDNAHATFTEAYIRPDYNNANVEFPPVCGTGGYSRPSANSVIIAFEEEYARPNANSVIVVFYTT